MRHAKSKSQVPFGFVELPAARSRKKPRRTGLTMVADFGLPYMQVDDLVTMAGRYIDLAKIAVGTSRLYDLAYLRRKLALYRKHKIRPFIGGQFQEYVFATYGEKKLRPFLLEAKRVGFDVVEVSDNCVELTPRQRRAQIRLAVECGLAVFGEVGLTGEIRPVTFGEERIREAAKQGFTTAIVPRDNLPRVALPGIAVIGVSRIDEALRAALNQPDLKA